MPEEATDRLRRSPLDDRHRALGATITGFGGWDMPLDYGSVLAEHQAVRERCGVFDLSHLGTIRVTGARARDCLQATFTNDVATLKPGRAQYSLCLNDDAGIVDDLLVYHLEWGFLVVPNAANAAAVLESLRSTADALGECELVDVKAEMACLAVQGPEAADVVTQAGSDVDGMSYLDCRIIAVASPGASASGVGRDAAPPDGGVLARSGYTGEHGYELFVPADRAPDLWDRVTAAGAVACGLGARDTLRLEMGYPLHGNDISPATTPVEAGLDWAVKPRTGFRGEDAYVAASERGASRRLWGLRATERGIPRAGCRVLRDGRAVGETTSGTFSPTLRIGVALAYLDTDVDAGDSVDIEVRGRVVPAEVVRPPFVDASPR